MNTDELEKLIAKCLHDFYDRRTKRIQELKLKEFMSKKNPYLFRAIGTEKASEIVEDVLRAFISSSDEGMFGDAFFEPIAKLASGGVVAPSEGVDVAIETENRYMAIAVKSGPHWGNSDQLRKQNENFVSLRSRLYKIQKQFDAVIGHGYGQKKGNPKGKIYRNVSGQAFWTEITGDRDFYLKLITLMKDEPQKHKPEYKKAWDAAVNRFTGEFIRDFCFSDGRIDWEKLVQFVSEDKTLGNLKQKKLG
jgi:hypothetical protein